MVRWLRIRTERPDVEGGLRAAVIAMVLAAGLVVLGSCDGALDPYGGTENDVTTIVAAVTQDEAAAPDVSVSLYASGGTTVIETKVTGADGKAEFTDLDAGTYDLEVVVPDGFVVSGDGSSRQSVTVSDGATKTASFALVTEGLPEPADTVVVEAVNFQFSPSDLTIQPNTLVRWVNTTGTRHTVTPDGHDEWVDAELPNMGSTFEHVFRTEGSFPYYCVFHQSAGMVGTVTVQAP